MVLLLDQLTYDQAVRLEFWGVEQGLKGVLCKLGLRQTEFADLLGVSSRSVSTWAVGGAEIPGPVCAYLRLLDRLSPDQRGDEFDRLPGRSKAFDDGFYRFEYSAQSYGVKDTSTAFCVLRNGKVVGSDPWGGKFEGDYTFSRAQGVTVVRVILNVPPDSVVITGLTAGQEGATFEIKGSFERPDPTSRATLKIQGTPVDVVATYLGPIPE